MQTTMCASCGARGVPREDGSCPSCLAPAVDVPVPSTSDESDVETARPGPEQKRRGPAKRVLYGIVGVPLFASGILLGIVSVGLFLAATGTRGAHRSATDNFLMIAASTVLSMMGAAALYWGRIFCNATRAPLAHDVVPRVILLRSFQDDATELPSTDNPWLRGLPIQDNSFEVTLLRECSQLGTCGAIGNPREILPPTGAARGYFSDATWKAQAIRYIEECDNIVVILGETDNLVWELGQIVTRNAARKVLLVMPLYGSAKVLWGRFRETHGPLVATPLPEEISDSA